jgi:hypothetical protein
MSGKNQNSPSGQRIPDVAFSPTQRDNRAPAEMEGLRGTLRIWFFLCAPLKSRLCTMSDLGFFRGLARPIHQPAAISAPQIRDFFGGSMRGP